MKRFTLIVVAALVATLSFAQKPVTAGNAPAPTKGLIAPTLKGDDSFMAIANSSKKASKRKVVSDEGCAAKMSFVLSSDGKTYTYDVVVKQNPETKVVTVEDFAGLEGASVDIILKEDHSFVIESQLINSTANGEFYTYSMTSTGGLDSPEIYGTGTDKVLTFGSGWTGYATTGYWMYNRTNTTITISDDVEDTFEYPVLEEVAATPAAPSVTDYLHYSTTRGGVRVTVDIPDTDEDGNDLKKDLLSYQIYVDNGESVTAVTDAIAYASTDSPVTTSNGAIKTITIASVTADPVRVGVKSIYAAAGETNETAITWFDVPALVTPPAGLTALEKSFCYAIGGAEAFIDANLIIDEANNEVYLQGISADYPDVWIKGTVDADNNFTFPKAQFLAIYSAAYDLYFYAEEDAVFTYDAETDVWKTNQELYINASRIRIYYLTAYDAGSTITERKDDPATPANPSFYGWNYNGGYVWLSIPTTDVDGKAINGAKLSFQLFSDIEGEIAPIVFTTDLYDDFDVDTSVVPYATNSENIFDYNGYKIVFFLMPEFFTFNKVGIQTIYTGGDEENKSDVVWSALLKPYAVTVDAQTADGEKYYTTFYGGYSYVADENTTVYTATVDESGEWVNLHEVEDNFIPYGNAVILESTSATIKLDGSRTGGTLADNDLKGVYADTAVEEGSTYYVLSAVDGTVGFYKFAGETLAAGKAYIEVAGEAEAKVLPFGGTTAINGVADVKAENATVYNLAGQRVSAAQKGVFIVNGKKVVF